MKEPDFQLFSSLRYDTLLLQSSSNANVWPGQPHPNPFYMLPLHRDRMLEAAQHFQWTEAVSSLSGEQGLLRLEEKLESVIGKDCQGPLRVRTVLHYNGNIEVETSITPTVPLENLFPARIPPPQEPLKISPLTGGVLSLGPQDSVQRQAGNGNPQQRQPWTVLVDPQRTEPSPFTTYKTTNRDMYTGARSRVGIESMTDPKEVLIISSVDGQIMEGSLTSVFFYRNSRWVTPPVKSGGQAGTTRRWLLEKG
jgi:4-amino-4-deoxychorismate lyase